MLISRKLRCRHHYIFWIIAQPARIHFQMVMFVLPLTFNSLSVVLSVFLLFFIMVRTACIQKNFLTDAILLNQLLTGVIIAYLSFFLTTHIELDMMRVIGGYILK